MCSIREITILAAGLLYCAAALADEQDAGAEDPATTDATRDVAPGVTHEFDTRYLDALNNGPYYTTRWPSPLMDATLAYTDDWPYAIPSVDFQEDNALRRASKLRNLSLLTLAEFGQSRLFFGVNDDGLVGLHFKALTADSDLRYLEVARLSYLEDEEPPQLPDTN